jgi:hypothetical protein
VKLTFIEKMKKHLLILSGLVLGGMSMAQNTPVTQTVQKRVAVLEELTGINCQYCPDGHKRANQIAAANPGKVVLVNIHAGSFAPTSGVNNFTTPTGNAWNTFFNPTGYPAGTVNRRAHSSDPARLATGRGNWAGMVNTVINENSEVNVAMDAAINATTRELTVTVELFYPTPMPSGTNHYLNVGITQDNIESPHVSMATNPDQVLPNGKYNNLHMFRMLVNNSGAWGDAFDASESGVITKTFTVTLPQSVAQQPLEFGNLHLYAFVHKGHNGVTDSQILSAAQVTPTYTNVPASTASLTAILNDFNAECNTSSSISPVVKVKNTGAAISSVDFSYSVNGGTASTYTYSTPIVAFGSANVTLPAISFPVAGSNNVAITLTSVNAGSGTVGGTATLSKVISSSATVGTVITLNINTDNYPTETSWELLNASNVVVSSGGPYAGSANGGGADALKKKSHEITLPGPGCYSLKLKDEYGDGVSYGTNPNGGVGFSVDYNGAQVYSMLKPTWDFGPEVTIEGIVLSGTASISDEDFITGMSLYPNPAENQLNVSVNMENSNMVNFRVVNAQGQLISNENISMGSSNSVHSLDVTSLAAGVYTIQIIADGKVSSKPFIKK